MNEKHQTEQSWKKEFYPKSAADRSVQANDLTRLQHSIRKWTGALPENLQKYGVQYDEHTIHKEDQLVLSFSGGTCALCIHYDDWDSGVDCFNRKDEQQCPIVRCTGITCDSDYNNTFVASTDDPTPMLELLEKTRKFVEDEVADPSGQ